MSDDSIEHRPRVTVVIPAHNAATFIHRALNSVAEQTYDDWEVVVADDASTDATLSVAESLAARHQGRMRVVRLERNSGPAAARNAAIAASSGGELIALLDADDRWEGNYLERQVAQYDTAVAEGRSPGIIVCNALIEGPDGRIDGTFADRFGWADPVDYDLMIRRSYIPVGSMFTRAAYNEVGGFSPDCWGSEDYDLWLRIMEAGYEVISTREPLAVYRHSEDSLSGNQLTMAEAGIAAYRRALQRGAVTPHQMRAIRTQLRHYRALRRRALTVGAWRRGERLKAIALAAIALPFAALAFVQQPSRWSEWLADAFRVKRDPRPDRPSGAGS